jgi:hypothetical protein
MTISIRQIRIRRFGETKVRDMRRMTVAGDAPTAELVAA